MWKSFLILGFMCYIANAMSGTTYVPVYNPTASMMGASGMFKCGGVLGDNKYRTEAQALSCKVIDINTCEGFLRREDKCKVVEYSYPDYAQFRATMEKKKVKFLGIAPMYVGLHSEFKVFVFVEVIPQ
jgi:hypothetical protein